MSAVHAPNTDRVRARTAEAINARIDDLARQRVADSTGQDVTERIRQLDTDWDFERVVEAEAAATGLLGLALGVTIHRSFLLIPGFVAAMMLLHAIDGWYPLLPLLRRLGLRTQDEIDRERFVLKALRGDFAGIRSAQADGRAEAAWNAVLL